MSEDLLYQIALKKLEGIGPSRAKKLISYCGGVKEVFEASKSQLAKIPSIGEMVIANINKVEALKFAEAEVRYLEKTDIRPIFFLDKAYPNRLKHCDDGPLLLYTKGEMNLNNEKIVSIVGTRNATEYGKKVCERLIEGLTLHNPLIVSGLALGIDVIAHKAALNNGLQTVGVLGNSLETVYPPLNRSVAEKMKTNGGLISEFESGTKPDRENFPQRNRIVAGMADVTIVIESAVKGGSMIMAKLAADYNHDVMAFPGPVDAPYSGGCNFLIKSQQAHLIEGIKDLEYTMGWEVESKVKKGAQRQLFVELTTEEKQLYDLIEKLEKESVDNISLSVGMPVSKTSFILLEMEFKGVVKSLPGKVYCLA